MDSEDMEPVGSGGDWVRDEAYEESVVRNILPAARHGQTELEGLLDGVGVGVNPPVPEHPMLSDLDEWWRRTSPAAHGWNQMEGAQGLGNEMGEEDEVFWWGSDTYANAEVAEEQFRTFVAEGAEFGESRPAVFETVAGYTMVAGGHLNLVGVSEGPVVETATPSTSTLHLATEATPNQGKEEESKATGPTASGFEKTLRSPSRKKYICPVCSMNLGSATALKGHKDIHDRPFHFKCPSCPQKFQGFSLRLQHFMQEHDHDTNQTKKFGCHICKKRSGNLKMLEDHMVIHSDARPLKFPQCGKGFKRKSSLNHHLKVQHSVGGSGQGREMEKEPETMQQNEEPSIGEPDGDDLAVKMEPVAAAASSPFSVEPEAYDYKSVVTPTFPRKMLMEVKKTEYGPTLVISFTSSPDQKLDEDGAGKVEWTD